MSALLAPLLLVLLLASCSSRQSYGVVLWSKNEAAIPTGSVVKIRSQSRLTDSFLIALPKGRGVAEIRRFRVSTFAHERDAVNFAAAYQPYVKVTAHAREAGVVLYQSADLSSQRLYRLRDDQEVKVIARLAHGTATASKGSAADPAKNATQGGAWYEVLTADGVLGYCEGADLSVGQERSSGVVGSTIDAILAKSYRPVSFEKMIESGRIDLTKFDPRYGFFPNPTERTLRIVTPKWSASYTYASILKKSDDRYDFVGSSVHLTIVSPDRIQLQYVMPDGKPGSEELVAMSDDEVRLDIQKEKNRRLTLYEGFLGTHTFRSDYYGTISFEADMSFQWRGLSRLRPEVVPQDASARGRVDFPLFLGDSLLGSYDGAVTFDFQGPTEEIPVSFLYTFHEGNLRLTYIAPSTVQDDVVNSVASPPLIIYFTRG